MNEPRPLLQDLNHLRNEISLSIRRAQHWLHCLSNALEQDDVPMTQADMLDLVRKAQIDLNRIEQ